MKVKSTFGLALLAVASGALSSCGGGKGGAAIEFWSSFGSAYTTVLDGIVAETATKVSASAGTNVEISHLSQGSYDKVKERMMSAISDLSYPDLVTGYPDHFAEYSANKILHPLDDLVKTYDQKHGTNLLNDYFPGYMTENYAIDCDDAGQPVLSALPFNKSTELMGYNGVFVDYCATIDPDLAIVPTTWQEWEVKGPKYREILDGFVGNVKQEIKGKCLYGIQDYEGTASNFEVAMYQGETYNGKNLLLNFTEVDGELSRVIGWDSTDNMFITLVRQWGAQYTNLTTTELAKNAYNRVGDIMFYSNSNKPKVIECMKFFNKLNKAHIFSTPNEFQASYMSDAFKDNKVMFMLCSSGGLSYNTAKWTNRFRVAPLPYNADLGDAGKYVISQGADITLTDNAQGHYDEAFEAMVEMTTGDLQAEWCLQTGYYPCSQSATNSAKYQEFLKEAEPEGIQKYMQETGCTEDEAKAHAYSVPTRVAYREGSKVNQEHYMNDSEHWTKFVDAAFKGSAVIRTLCKAVFEDVFVQTNKDITTEECDAILYNIISNDKITRNNNIRVITND